MLEPVKVKCIFLRYQEIIVGNKLWRLDDITSKVVLYRNMGFNENGKYKKTFIGFGLGTGSMQVLHEFKFEVEPLGDHKFEVEPLENVDQGAGLQEVKTQDLMDYQLTRDRDQHLAYELSGYREDNNEDAFAVAAKAGLEEDMDVRSDVYVLSNGCKKSSDDSHDYYWEYAPATRECHDESCRGDKSCGEMRGSYGEANTTKNLVGRLNALIVEMEALEDQGELFDTLMDLMDDRKAARTKLQGLNELITQAEYGSILNILQGRNELLEKIIGCVVDSGGVPKLDSKVSNIWGIMETKANDLDHLVNYDNDNDLDDLGYELEVYLDEEEEDENNHSNRNVVKRDITRLSKFYREYEKPNGIKLSVTFDALNKISGKHRALFSSFLGNLVKSAAAKMACSKSIYQHTIGRDQNKEIKPYEEPLHGILWLKGRVSKDREFSNDEIRSVGDKLKETEDKIKEGTLKVDHDTDAITVVLVKEKGGYSRGVGSRATYKRYFDLPRSRQASDERIVLLQSQLDNERRERQEKELEIQNLFNKMSQTEGVVTKLMNQWVVQGEQLKSMSIQLTPPDVSLVDINPIDSSADDKGGTPIVGCENDASIQKSNGLATLEKEMKTR
nr:hypothetical protein [Tanacetum cinerariifolium]